MKTNKLQQYFQLNGHLTDEGIAQYAESLKLDKLESLPQGLRQHIDTCNECHSQALDLYALIADFDYSELALTPAPQPHVRRIGIRRALLAAASIAALIWMLSILWRPHTGTLQPTDNQQVGLDTQFQKTPIPPSVEQKPQPEVQRPEAKISKEALAANFEPSETLEQLLEGTTRGEEIQIGSPLNTATFKTGQAIKFAWTAGTEAGPLWIIILNNHNKEQSRLEAGTEGLTFTGQLSPGIYYWKLENETDLIYVGKFFIR